MINNFKKIWFISLFFKIVLAAIIPLSADESYYWVWSQNLQLSYYDHPAMVAWLFKLGEPFDFLGHAVRWPAVLMGHLTLLIWILILDEIDFNFEKIKWWAILVLFSPMLGFGSLVVTPDLPIVFFWSTSIYFLIKHLKNNSTQNSILLGASLGLGFCSKYHIVLFVPITLLFLAFEKHWAKFKFRNILYISVAGLVFSLPVLIWNFNNNFSSFYFQINHGLGRSEWQPYWTYTYPIGQILLIFPILLWSALLAKPNKDQKFLLYFSYGPLIFFLFTSFRGIVEMNWPIIAYPCIYALSVLSERNSKKFVFSVCTWLIIYTIIFSNIYFPWIPNAPAKFSELTYFQSTLSAHKKYQPLYAENYQMASYLWYSTKTPTYKLFQMSRIDFYDSLSESIPKDKVFYVVMNKNAGFPDWLNKTKHKSILVETLDETFVVKRVELL